MLPNQHREELAPPLSHRIGVKSLAALSTNAHFNSFQTRVSLGKTLLRTRVKTADTHRQLATEIPATQT